MAKYDPLGKWLSEQTANTCTPTFNQVEKIIGGALPESATTHRTWWANHRSHSQAQSWMSAGWKVENLRFIASVSVSKQQPERIGTTSALRRSFEES